MPDIRYPFPDQLAQWEREITGDDVCFWCGAGLNDPCGSNCMIPGCVTDGKRELEDDDE